MNFLFCVVLFAGMANAETTNLTMETYKYLRDAIAEYLVIPPPSALKRVKNDLKSTTYKGPLGQLSKEGVMDCIDRFFFPDKEFNFCYVTYLPLYSDKCGARNLYDQTITSSKYVLIGGTTIKLGQRITQSVVFRFWDAMVKLIPNHLYTFGYDAESLLPILVEFNEKKVHLRTKKDYADAFRDAIQPIMTSYADVNKFLTSRIMGDCIYPALNLVGKFFGVAPIVTLANNGEWVVEITDDFAGRNRTTST